MTIKTSFLGHVVPVYLPPLRPPCLPSSLLLSVSFSQNLARCLFWKWIRLLSWAKHQIRALTLCIILCMTLRSALVPLSFYPSTGQCADMVSAPHIFGSFLLQRIHWFAFLSVFWLLYVCMCHFVWPSGFVGEHIETLSCNGRLRGHHVEHWNGYIFLINGLVLGFWIN